jgi:hypothetical protein
VPFPELYCRTSYIPEDSVSQTTPPPPQPSKQHHEAARNVCGRDRRVTAHAQNTFTTYCPTHQVATHVLLVNGGAVCCHVTIESADRKKRASIIHSKVSENILLFSMQRWVKGLQSTAMHRQEQYNATALWAAGCQHQGKKQTKFTECRERWPLIIEDFYLRKMI